MQCVWSLARVSNHSNSLPFSSSRPGRPPKRAPVGLSLAASHLQHQQMKKHRMDNGDYPYENGHMGAGQYCEQNRASLGIYVGIMQIAQQQQRNDPIYHIALRAAGNAKKACPLTQLTTNGKSFSGLARDILKLLSKTTRKNFRSPADLTSDADRIRGRTAI